MRIVSGLVLGLLSVASAHAAPPHYRVNADFDPQGNLKADVTVTLTEATSEKAFLLSRRFALEPMKLPHGVTVTTEPAEKPVEELTRYTFHFAKPTAAPVKLRFRYAGQINTKHDSNAAALRPEGFELFIDHMWIPIGADIQTRFTVDADIEGLAPDLVVVAQGDVKRTRTGVRIHRDFIDIDLPMVAMQGLQRAEAHGVEFFGRDLSTRLSGFYVKGPLILWELDKRIGRAAMDRLMIAMAREPVHTTPIFLKHLTAIAGADQAKWFETAMRT